MKTVKFNYEDEYELKFFKNMKQTHRMNVFSGSDLLVAISEYIDKYWNETESVTVTHPSRENKKDFNNE